MVKTYKKSFKTPFKKFKKSTEYKNYIFGYASYANLHKQIENGAVSFKELSNMYVNVNKLELMPLPHIIDSMPNFYGLMDRTTEVLKINAMMSEYLANEAHAVVFGKTANSMLKDLSYVSIDVKDLVLDKVKLKYWVFQPTLVVRKLESSKYFYFLSAYSNYMKLRAYTKLIHEVFMLLTHSSESIIDYITELSLESYAAKRIARGGEADLLYEKKLDYVSKQNAVGETVYNQIQKFLNVISGLLASFNNHVLTHVNQRDLQKLVDKVKDNPSFKYLLAFHSPTDEGAFKGLSEWFQLVGSKYFLDLRFDREKILAMFERDFLAFLHDNFNSKEISFHSKGNIKIAFKRLNKEGQVSQSFARVFEMDDVVSSLGDSTLLPSVPFSLTATYSVPGKIKDAQLKQQVSAIQQATSRSHHVGKLTGIVKRPDSYYSNFRLEKSKKEYFKKKRARVPLKFKIYSDNHQRNGNRNAGRRRLKIRPDRKHKYIKV